MADNFVLKLKHPFESPINKKTIDQVSMRLPVLVEDMIVGAKSSSNGMEQTRHIIARLTALDVSEVAKMSWLDYSKLAGAMGLEDEEGKD
jgi:hypothetical protein